MLLVVDKFGDSGDVIGGWPERLNLVTVQGGQSVQEYLLGHVQILGHLGRATGPACNFLQALEADKEARYFQADLPLDGRCLATFVAMLDMNCFMSQEAPPLNGRELRVNPNPPTIRGRNYVRVRTIPNNHDVRE